MQRNRPYYCFLILLTIIIGLASRHFSNYLPEIINLGLGDALWALMMYWMIAFVFPAASIRNLTAMALSVCFLVEFSQLIQVDWLNTLRSNRFAALVLGQGFLWSDLLAYTIGVASGMAIELNLMKRKVAA
ncbi:DUF2809 domain-containing protein [Marinifilum flexuosum]|uniref:ribosomal maturation YjgA family protein n=1 Tax=Marinifilum flexuosum TaxID=1117708 RepID=UPI0024912FF2|nr:DUF2809 domain-containing protein [Marinifilum flexuosum]